MGPKPCEFRATTVTPYVLPLVNPSIAHVRSFTTRAEHDPSGGSRETAYPRMALDPIAFGFDQVTTSERSPIATATLVGAPGEESGNGFEERGLASAIPDVNAMAIARLTAPRKKCRQGFFMPPEQADGC